MSANGEATGVEKGAPADLSFWQLLRADLRRKARWYFESCGSPSLLRVLLTDGTCAMILYRLMQWSRRYHLFPLELIFNKMNSIFNHCIIGRGAEFGPGLVLIHAHGVVIDGKVRGGSNIAIEHEVTLGSERRQSPTLGNGVFIGTGAKIIGPVTIGDGARIGANALVIDDVPAYATAVSVPAQLVRMRTPSQRVDPYSGPGGGPSANFERN